MPQPGTNFQHAYAWLAITASQDGVKTVRPPVLAVPAKRNFSVGVGAEIFFVEGHVMKEVLISPIRRHREAITTSFWQYKT
jgi:hypothetical protein